MKKTKKIEDVDKPSTVQTFSRAEITGAPIFIINFIYRKTNFSAKKIKN